MNKYELPDEINQALRINAVLTLSEVSRVMDIFSMHLACTKNVLNQTDLTPEHRLECIGDYYNTILDSLRRTLERPIRNTSGL